MTTSVVDRVGDFGGAGDPRSVDRARRLRGRGARPPVAGLTLFRMGIGEALRRLDDRVIGVPKPASAASYRAIFFVGLVGTLAVLAVVIATGDGTAFAAIGVFVVFMIGGGVRWVRTTKGKEG